MRKILTIAILLGCLLIFGLLFTNCHPEIEISGSSLPKLPISKKPIVKVFLENSGSMDGYMCDGSQLKDAVYDYVSDLSRASDTTFLYFINSNIIPYKGSLQAYIKDMTPATFHSAGGNTSNTDIGDLIDKVLSTVNDTTISVFISDCILDLPSKNAKDFFNNCEITIKQHIIDTQKKIPDLGVEIIQLTSKFSGKFFSPNGDVELLTDVKRPYYIWIFGPKNYMAEFNADALKTLKQSKYNFKGMISFSNESDTQYEVSNRSFTSQIVRPSNNEYLMAMKVNLSSTLQPEDIICNKHNYRFINSTLEIEEIKPIDSKGPSNFTHVIYFKMPEKTNILQDRLTFNSPDQLPSWVSQSNDEEGVDINSNLDKTTGIEYLIQGVADAYKNEKILSSYEFKVKRL